MTPHLWMPVGGGFRCDYCGEVDTVRNNTHSCLTLSERITKMLQSPAHIPRRAMSQTLRDALDAITQLEKS